MNNKDLESKSEIKSLGIMVDENLRFSNNIIDKVNKANQIMGIITQPTERRRKDVVETS